MHHTSLLLFILLSHHHLTRTTAEEQEAHCGWTKVMANQEETHYSFLRKSSPSPSSSSSPSVRLYHSVWSTEERAPLGCAWSDDAAVIEHYLTLCVEERSSSEFTQQHHHDEPFDLSLLFDHDGMMCVDSMSPSKAGREEEEGRPVGQRLARSVAEMNDHHQGHLITGGHRRVKRGFIVPGTLWCGSGNKAPSYADLGVFSGTDSCCREHDQCKDTILSFQSSYGVFNSNIFTMSHCGCDKKFRSCLAAANDSISNVVGYTFFNVLKLNCFEFSHRLQCTLRNWFGRCKENKMAPYAVVHQATQYGGHESSSNNTAHFNISTVISATFSTQGQVTTGGQEENSSTSQSGSVSLSARTASSSTSGVPGVSLTTGTGSVSLSGRTASSSTSGVPGVSLTTGTGSVSLSGRTASSSTSGVPGVSLTTGTGSVSLSGRTASSSTSGVPGVSLTTGTGSVSLSGRTASSSTSGVPGVSLTTGTASVSLSGRTASSSTSGVPGVSLTTGTGSVSLSGRTASSSTSGVPGVSLTTGTGSVSLSGRTASSSTSGVPGVSLTNGTGSVSLSGRTASSSTSGVPGVSLTTGTARSTPMSMPVRTSTGLDNVSTGGPRIVTPSPPHTVRLRVSNGLTRPQPQQDTSANTGKPLSCVVFTDLDGCKFKIFPQQRKYGLDNRESRTLYHCNCTTRLFQSLAQQEETTMIQALLLDYVSDSCFFTQEACSQGKTCSAAVVKQAALLPQLKKPSGIMEAGRPLEAIRLKVRKQPNSRRAKRKDGRPVRLQKLCVRMSNNNNRTKQPSKNTKVHSTEEDR